MVDLTYLKSNVFPGESGGDYNALFGYANRPGGQFENVKLTDMTVSQALQFSNPSGAYGQYVLRNRPDPEMGVATPMGAYQVVGKTLEAAMKGLGLTGNERMTPELQDKIGQWIYQNQGPQAWEAWGGSNGGSTVRGSSRNFSGGPDLEPEQTGLLGFITDPEKRARLALALSGMALNPNQAVQALAQDKLATAETGRINNRTAQWLSQRGRDDLAEAVMRGIVPAKEAVTQAMQPDAGPERGVVVGGNVVNPLTGEIIYQGPQDTGTEAPATFVALDMQARAAGLVPQSEGGDGRYETFMLTRGAGSAAEAAAAGRAAAEAATAAPNIEQQRLSFAETAQDSINLIDSIIDDPALSGVTGMVQGRLPPLTQSGTNLVAKIEQVQGQSFLQAFESLKGGGAITEREGIAAQNAIARLQRTQDQNAYIAALNELKTILDRGRRRALAGVRASEGDTYSGTNFNGVTVGEGF